MRLAEVFGANVRAARLARGMSLEALADAAGLAYSYTGGIERGQKNPSFTVAERIAAALHTPVLDLLSPRARSG